MNVRTFTRRQLLPLSLVALGMAWLAFREKNAAPRFVVPEADLAPAKALIDAEALVVDVRTQKAFDARHLPNAVLFSLAMLRIGIPPALSAARGKQIVVYCNEGVSSGPEATHLLLQAGFQRVVNMKSGIEGWVAAGFPVVSA